MRTKHLLTAMVLPALFAACTNEELDVVNNVESLDSRAVVENVKLTVGETVDSRLVYSDGYSFEVGDQIGAALMDQINDNYRKTVSWSSWFDLVNYIQTNYKFTKTGNEWETEAKLCEGNYFFAFPYNANIGLRDAYSFTCANQTLGNTDRDALMDAFAKNNAFVGYGKVAAGSNEGESVKVDMVPVFDVTGFTLKNTGTNTYKIEKVVLSGAAVSAKATVKPASSQLFSVAKQTGEVPAGNYNKIEALQSVLEYDEDVNRIDVTVAAGNSVSPQQSIDVIVMSAVKEIAAENDAILEIHTNKGLIRGINLNTKHQALNGTVEGENNVVNVLTDKALPALGKADKIVVTFDDTSLDIPEKMDIYSTDELTRFIKWNMDVYKANLTATLAGNVTITKEMCEDLAASEINSITVKGAYNVTIAADAPENAMDLFTFDGVTVNVNGTQSITDIEGKKDIDVNIIVNAGATLNVSDNILAKVENNGTVNIKKNVTVNVLENVGALVVDANLSTQRLLNHGAVTNNSTLKIVSTSQFVSTSNLSHNHGTITNNGTLNGNNMFENKLKGECTCEDPNDTAEEGKGVIDNYGTVSGIINSSRVNMKSADAEYNSSTDNSTGEIENSIMSKYVNKATNETIIVEVSGENNASEVAAIVKGSGASKLNLSGTLVLDPEKNANGTLKMINVVGQEATLEVVAKGLTITGEGEIAFRQNKEENGTRANFTVYSGTTTIVETGVTMYVNQLTVNGAMKIQKGAVVDTKGYKGTITNYGTLK